MNEMWSLRAHSPTWRRSASSGIASPQKPRSLTSSSRALCRVVSCSSRPKVLLRSGPVSTWSRRSRGCAVLHVTTVSSSPTSPEWPSTDPSTPLLGPASRRRALPDSPTSSGDDFLGDLVGSLFQQYSGCSVTSRSPPHGRRDSRCVHLQARGSHLCIAEDWPSPSFTSDLKADKNERPKGDRRSMEDGGPDQVRERIGRFKVRTMS